jgi:hypothetical protein
MRTALITCLFAAGVIATGSSGVFAQSVCEARCQGSSICLQKCAAASKRRSSVKHRDVAPGPSSGASDRSDDWRERAFRIEGGTGGGGGGSGGSM